MKIICISGHARAGKDTFATYLKHFLNQNSVKDVLITHYADLVKYVCRQFFDWDGNKDEYGRSLLQKVGTDIVRSRDEDYWARFILDMIKFFPDRWEYVIIPDCRFPNEVKLFRDAGYEVIHIQIVRDNFDNMLTEEQKHHPSETSMDGVIPDISIQNNGDLDNLISSAKMCLGECLL